MGDDHLYIGDHYMKKLFKKENLSGTFGGVIEAVYISAIGIVVVAVIICAPKISSFLGG